MLMVWIWPSWAFCDEPGCVLAAGHGGDHKYAKGT